MAVQTQAVTGTEQLSGSLCKIGDYFAAGYGVEPGKGMTLRWYQVDDYFGKTKSGRFVSEAVPRPELNLPPLIVWRRVL